MNNSSEFTCNVLYNQFSKLVEGDKFNSNNESIAYRMGTYFIRKKYGA